MTNTVARAARAALLLAVVTLGGCLLTVGSPLVRKVEPDQLVMEAGGGGLMIGSGAAFGGAGYLYVGRSLGKHVEIGILPVVAGVEGGSGLWWSLTAPVRWDPFPYEAPLHLIVFGGPSLTVTDATYPSVLAGAGLSWQPVKWMEAYASASVPVTGSATTLAFLTASAGARFPLLPSFELGAGVTWTYPYVFTAMLAGTVRTKPAFVGYGF